MIKNKITKKQSKIVYISSVIIIFISLCIIPTVGILIKKPYFQCEDCNFFYNFIASLIAIILWSIFFGIFYIALFSKDVRNEKIKFEANVIKKIYVKYLQSSARGKIIQSFGLLLPIMIACFFILKLFFYQIIHLIN